MTSTLASLSVHMSSLRVEELEDEGSFYIGTVLSAVIYGFYLGVYCLSIRALLMSTSTTRLHRNAYISFSSVLLLLNTVYFIQMPYIGRMMWIVTRNSYPDGPFAYYNLEVPRAPVDLLSNIAQTIGVTLNESLLVYRCHIIFGSRLYIVVLPIFCSLGALALGTATVPLSLSYGSRYSILIIDRLNAAGVVLNTFVNVMITAMISIKIYSISRMLSKSIGSTPTHARAYTNIVAILVESAAPCAILGILTSAACFMAADTVSAFGLSTETIDLTWSMSIAIFP